MDLFEILPNLRWVAKTGVGKLRRFDMENDLGSGHLLLLDKSANSFRVVSACGTALHLHYVPHAVVTCCNLTPTSIGYLVSQHQGYYGFNLGAEKIISNLSMT
jgi:hypothetical protein